MRALISFIFTYDAVLLCLAALAVWLFVRPASRAARRVLLGVALFYTLVGTYGMGELGARLLVRGFHPIQRADIPPASTTAIVILGSGSFSVRDWSDRQFSNVDFAAASRVLEAVRVYNMIGSAWVISSGGHVVPDDPNEATAVTMHEALLRLGVPDSRVLVETRSRNTHEEAIEVKPILERLGANQVILVTSDTHMRRSLATFRAEGIQAIPAIARQPFLRVLPHEWVLPSEIGFWRGSTVAHEVLGIVYYAARGWYTGG